MTNKEAIAVYRGGEILVKIALIIGVLQFIWWGVQNHTNRPMTDLFDFSQWDKSHE